MRQLRDDTHLILDGDVRVYRRERSKRWQAAFASLGALASLISFPMMTQLFASQLSNEGSANTWHSGAPFLLAAGLGGLALLLLIVTVKLGLATKGGQAVRH